MNFQGQWIQPEDNHRERLRAERQAEYNQFLAQGGANTRANGRRKQEAQPDGPTYFIEPQAPEPRHKGNLNRMYGGSGPNKADKDAQRKMQYKMELEQQIQEAKQRKEREKEHERQVSRENQARRMKMEEAELEQGPVPWSDPAWHQVSPKQPHLHHGQYGAGPPPPQYAGYPQHQEQGYPHAAPPPNHYPAAAAPGGPPPAGAVGGPPPEQAWAAGPRQAPYGLPPQPGGAYAPGGIPGLPGGAGPLQQPGGPPVGMDAMYGATIGTAAQQRMDRQRQYALELQQQIKEKEVRKEAEKQERKRREEKEEQEAMNYNPFGRAGGGAPLRGADGEMQVGYGRAPNPQQQQQQPQPPPPPPQQQQQQQQQYEQQQAPQYQQQQQYQPPQYQPLQIQEAPGGAPPPSAAPPPSGAGGGLPGGGAGGAGLPPGYQPSFRSDNMLLSEEELSKRQAAQREMQEALQAQIDEKKRLKEAEKEAERENERREEARLQREQDALRNQFDAEKAKEKNKNQAFQQEVADQAKDAAERRAEEKRKHKEARMDSPPPIKPASRGATPPDLRQRMEQASSREGEGPPRPLSSGLPPRSRGSTPGAVPSEAMEKLRADLQREQEALREQMQRQESDLEGLREAAKQAEAQSEAVRQEMFQMRDQLRDPPAQRPPLDNSLRAYSPSAWDGGVRLQDPGWGRNGTPGRDPSPSGPPGGLGTPPAARTPFALHAMQSVDMGASMAAESTFVPIGAGVKQFQAVDRRLPGLDTGELMLDPPPPGNPYEARGGGRDFDSRGGHGGGRGYDDRGRGPREYEDRGGRDYLEGPRRPPRAEVPPTPDTLQLGAMLERNEKKLRMLDDMQQNPEAQTDELDDLLMKFLEMNPSGTGPPAGAIPEAGPPLSIEPPTVALNTPQQIHKKRPGGWSRGGGPGGEGDSSVDTSANNMATDRSLAADSRFLSVV